MVKTIDNSVGVSDWYRVIKLLKRADNLQRIANGVSVALKVSTLNDNFFECSRNDTAAATISVDLDTRDGNCYVTGVEPYRVEQQSVLWQKNDRSKREHFHPGTVPVKIYGNCFC
jgi:hypothetical protein